MSYSIDAHLLIHASDTSSPEHRAACDFLIGRAADPDLLCLIWATLMAYLVPDAHIATVLRRHGVLRIFTADTDFRKFAFLEVINPLR